MSESLSVFISEALWTVTGDVLTVNLQHHLVQYFLPSLFFFFLTIKWVHLSSCLFSSLCSSWLGFFCMFFFSTSVTHKRCFIILVKLQFVFPEFVALLSVKKTFKRTKKQFIFESNNSFFFPHFEFSLKLYTEQNKWIFLFFKKSIKLMFPTKWLFKSDSFAVMHVWLAPPKEMTPQAF